MVLELIADILGWLFLFGRLEVGTNVLTRVSFEEMIIEDEINEIEKIRI